MVRMGTEVMTFILRTRLTEAHKLKVVVVTRKIEGAGAKEVVAEAGGEVASNTSPKVSLRVSSKSNQSTNRSMPRNLRVEVTTMTLMGPKIMMTSETTRGKILQRIPTSMIRNSMEDTINTTTNQRHLIILRGNDMTKIMINTTKIMINTTDETWLITARKNHTKARVKEHMEINRLTNKIQKKAGVIEPKISGNTMIMITVTMTDAIGETITETTTEMITETTIGMIIETITGMTMAIQTTTEEDTARITTMTMISMTAQK